MSDQEWNTKQTVPRLERLELTNEVLVEIPDDLLNKIKYLCRAIVKVEWSGILFYEMQGTIKKPEKAKIILRDILLMDKGTKTYTSFDWDQDVVEYRMDNPDSMDWHIGHIHSHNDMGVFFSATDWSELNDNCPQHNIYLSVIVNNYMDIKAKIAFTAESQKFICKDEEGKDYNLTINSSTLNPFMFIYDCKFSMPENNIVVPKSFANRIGIVEKKSEATQKKEEEEKAAKLKLLNNSSSTVGKKEEKSSFPYWSPPGNRSKKELDEETEYWENFKKKFGVEEDDDFHNNFTLQTIEKDFATYLLRLGNDTVVDDELEDALSDIEGSNLNPNSFASSILDSYGAYYEHFFDKIDGYRGDKAFLYVLEKVIEIFEENLDMYPFLKPIIERLTNLGIKYEQTLKEGVI